MLVHPVGQAVSDEDQSIDHHARRQTLALKGFLTSSAGVAGLVIGAGESHHLQRGRIFGGVDTDTES